MRVRSTSDLLSVIVAWLPLLIALAAVTWVLVVGVLHLEINSFGTEFLVRNDQTANRLAPIGGRDDAAALQAALDSGDIGRMNAALADLEQRQPTD